MRKGGRGVKRSIMVYGSTMMCTMLLHLREHVYMHVKAYFLGIRMTLSNRPPTLHVHVKVLLLHENKHSMKMIGIADLIINK